MRRNLHSTITGWKWLDHLTHPFWVAYCHHQKRRLHKETGRG